MFGVLGSVILLSYIYNLNNIKSRTVRDGQHGTTLLVAEFYKPVKRHIVSVFKIIQELLASSQKKGRNQFQQLTEMLSKIEAAEMMFSESRKKITDCIHYSIVFTIIKNCEKEGAGIIIDNTQLTILGGFAPNSGSAEVLLKSLSNRTVMFGSVSRGKNDPMQILQMIECPLMTLDEVKSMPKGQFVVMKMRFYLMKVKLKLFFKLGIQFKKNMLSQSMGIVKLPM